MKWPNGNAFGLYAKICRSGALAMLLPLGAIACSTSGSGDAPREEITEKTSPLVTCVTFQRGLYGTVVDATLKNPPLGNNFGSHHMLEVNKNDEALLRFDLSSISSSVSVQSATLKLYAQGNGSSTIGVHRATASWSEGSVTYASFNQQFDPAVAGLLNAQTQNALKSVDVTSLVANWIDGTYSNYGVLLETSGNVTTNFKSSDASGFNRPALRVCYDSQNPCGSNPCDHGSCTNGPSNTYTCTCDPGYTGTDCDVDIDDCVDNPCLNSGNCSDQVSGYTCSCQPGFTGTNCETNVNECSPNPCLNGGVCTDGVNAYSCACPPGYVGTNCETLIDYCSSSPCANGGTCSNTGAGYTCSCAAGYSGTSCETNVDECSPNPCQNGGICTDGVNSYTCQCAPGWGGSTCGSLLNNCSPNPCKNGGSCTNLLLTYSCSCATGYSGTNCEVNIDDCSSAPCQNGGVCQDGVNAYTCACQPGFEGGNCQTSSCADQNACTTDGFDAQDGCYHTPIDCDDSNSSTLDSCDPGVGCLHEAVDCDDFNACTTDTYNDGCVYTEVNCDDSNSNTVDSCNPVDGSCNHESCTTCGGNCVDIETDPTNCGGCSNACDTGYDCTAGLCVSPEGNLRIVLTWSTPGDLDLHIGTPNGNTIYYDNVGPDSGTDFGTYSQDDTIGTGPETVYWEDQYTPPSGTYHVCVGWWNGGAVSFEAIVARPGQPDLALSGAYSDDIIDDSSCNPSNPTYLGSFSYGSGGPAD